MNTEELYQQKESMWTEVKRLENELWQKRQEFNKANQAFISAQALDKLGLKKGDVVEVTETTYRRSQTYRFKIDKFRANSLDSIPSMEGFIIRKNGTVGATRKLLYPTLDTYTWCKVTDTEPTPSPQS